MYNLSQIKLNFQKDTVTRLEDVSDADYFGEKYKDYISNSMLKLINPDEGGSPTKFLVGNKGGKHSEALELGSAVHQMILEKDKYYVNDVQKPSGKVGLVIELYHSLLLNGIEDKEALIEACKQHDYYKSNLTQVRLDNVLTAGAEYLAYLQESSRCDGCITLTTEQKEKLDACLVSVKQNKLIEELLYPENAKVFNEDVLIMGVKATMPAIDEADFEDKEVDMLLKAKIDNWSIDLEGKTLTLNDLKTTGASIATFGGTAFDTLGMNGEVYIKRSEGSFQKFRYYRQMAMYAFLLKSYAEQEYGMDHTWTFNINMLVVETNAPHLSHVFSVSLPWLQRGEYEFTSLLKRIAFHRAFGFDTFMDLDQTKITTI